jgi:hypothetical protein
MESSALLREVKGVGQDDAQIHDDFARGDAGTVHNENGEAAPRREPRVGLWFWAVELK